jgi:RNA polymerase sigma-70 factor (ECF subfamily)
LARGGPDEAALKALVDAARRGDVQASEDLVRTTWASTYTLAFRLMGNEEDALDVTQETYLRAFRGLPRFRGEARFSTWLYRVTANCASSQLSRSWRSRHDQLDLDKIDEAQMCDGRREHDPEACASAGEDRASLALALRELPWRLRQVVVLRDVYDLSHRSIAAELGISEAAAKVRLQRARKLLREDAGCHLRGLDGPDQRRRMHLGQRSRRDAAHQDRLPPNRVPQNSGTAGGPSPVVEMDDDAVAS